MFKNKIKVDYDPHLPFGMCIHKKYWYLPWWVVSNEEEDWFLNSTQQIRTRIRYYKDRGWGYINK